MSKWKYITFLLEQQRWTELLLCTDHYNGCNVNHRPIVSAQYEVMSISCRAIQSYPTTYTLKDVWKIHKAHYTAVPIRKGRKIIVLFFIWLSCVFNDKCVFSSVQFSRSVMSDSLRSHESQHTRPPCPSQTPGVHSNSCPSSQWCHPAISSSVNTFSSCPQSLLASESFPMSQLFA